MKYRAYGFTIVELLIVVVVIVILSALSYVGYTNISNRANDSVVQSDLSQFVKQIRLLYAERGEYPEGGVVRIDSATSAPGPNHRNIGTGAEFSFSKQAYSSPTAAGSANVIYCTGPRLDTGEHGFSVLAQSTSGNMYKFNSDDSGQLIGSRSISLGVALVTACANYDYPRSYSYGYSVGNGWTTWAH